MYVPQIYWDWCRPKVLVMERIYGIQVTDLEALADQRPVKHAGRTQA